MNLLSITGWGTLRTPAGAAIVAEALKSDQGAEDLLNHMASLSKAKMDEPNLLDLCALIVVQARTRAGGHGSHIKIVSYFGTNGGPDPRCRIFLMHHDGEIDRYAFIAHNVPSSHFGFYTVLATGKHARFVLKKDSSTNQQGYSERTELVLIFREDANSVSKIPVRPSIPPPAYPNSPRIEEFWDGPRPSEDPPTTTLSRPSSGRIPIHPPPPVPATGQPTGPPMSERFSRKT